MCDLSKWLTIATAIPIILVMLTTSFTRWTAWRNRYKVLWWLDVVAFAVFGFLWTACHGIG